jgi:photosystem II stability/assembly factor-like uncharacterized protein
MKRIDLLLCTALFCLSLYSCKKDVLEPRLARQVTVPTQDDLNRVLFVNDTLGYLVGGEKYLSTVLLSTTDGGETWTPFENNWEGNKAIYGLAANGTGIYAVGYEGKIYIKNDSGPGQWQRVQTPAWGIWMQAVAFPEPDKGYIVCGEGYRAGHIYRTDPNGNIALVDSFEYQLSDIQFPSAGTGYICGYGAVMKTTDGGDSWHLLNVKGDFFKSISCLGNDEVWCVGYNGTIVHTADGGASWDKLRNGDNPLLKKYRLRSVAFRDRNTGYAAGDKGLIIKTVDGGKHWGEMERLTDNDFKSITLHRDGSLWVTGAKGTLFHIRD